MKSPALVASTGSALLLLGCASAVESSKLEDKARRQVPVPICVKPLERSATGVSKVGPEDYWKMVLPTYDAASGSLAASSLDCAGRQPFVEAEMLDAKGPRGGSLPAKPEQAVVTPGPDGFRVVWLRLFEFPDGSWSGPLALIRPREGYAEVYGTGAYRGKVKTSRFSFERMGSRIVVTATDDGCSEAKPGQGCETAFDVFLLGQGRLGKAASFPLDRIEYRPFAGLPGLAKHRLTATPVFQDRAMRVVEQIIVQDQNQGTVRKSDLERVFKLSPRGELEPSAPSLWNQVAPEGEKPPAPAPAPASKDKPKAPTSR